MTTPHRDLIGKHALVTGGAKRVGRAVALRLAQAGLDVAITYQHSKDEADLVTKEIRAMGRKAFAIQADFAQVDAARHVADKVLDAFGNLYALVNNASCFSPTPIGKVTPDDFEKNMAVNARSPMLLLQALAPALSSHDTPGRVVNFVDIHVMGQPLVGYLAYNMSKAALHELTMTAAMELAPKITVNAIAPGVVAWADAYSEQDRKDYMRRVPLARPGTPEDAATAVLFLVQDADYCTGQILRLDGGRLWT